MSQNHKSDAVAQSNGMVRLFKAEKQKREAEVAWAQAKAQSDATAAKTVRLRELRLAKEAEDQVAADIAAAEKATQKAAAKPKRVKKAAARA